MSLQELVLGAIRNWYPNLPRSTEHRMASEIVTVVLKQLHDTGALSVPPEDLAHFPMTDPHNETP